MNTYPRTAWIFGKVSCEVRSVVLTGLTPFGNKEISLGGENYKLSELYETEREALAGAKAYLDRKQAEIDELQANVDRRRNFLRQQLSVCT